MEVNQSATDVLMKIQDLTMYFPIFKGIIFKKRVGWVKAVNGLDFTIRQGETFGLVGESGCGKSTTALAILQLYKITGGRVFFDGIELNTLPKETLRKMRRRMQIIFQDPYSSLNPRMTIGNIIAEPMDVHNLVKRNEKIARIQELLKIVGLEPDFMHRYPHQFSGGQRQRIGIARALAAEPDFIVCDEPISALDVSIQAQIINLLQKLQSEYGLTYLFIAHNLAVIRHISDRIGVMYLGKLVELTTCKNLYCNSLHPYTQSLISAVPIPDPLVEEKRKIIILPGDVPSPSNPPPGCNFCTRCPKAMDICREVDPEIKDMGSAGESHIVACHLY